VRSAPAVRATVAKRPVPNVVFTVNGDCTITHTEYITDVSIATYFRTLSYDIDPQESSTFTWLSAIASRFEKFSFSKLSFAYKPSCSTTTNGWVILGYDPDYYDSAPNKATALSWRDSVKLAPWQSAEVNASKTVSELGRRFHGPSTLGDQRLTNFGKLWVLSDQASADQNVGEIFVHYTVKFHIPAIKLPPALFGTVERPAPAGPFVQRTGNVRITPGLNNDEFDMHSIGSYYVTVISNWGTTIVDNYFTFLTPAYSLLTEYTFTAFNFVADAAGRSIHTYLVTLIAGVLTFKHITSGTGGYNGAKVFISTGKDVI
jgi:hypothetical protein